jgi:hypothetical protein
MTNIEATNIDDDTRRDAELLTLLRVDGHTIIEALYRYVDRMQENERTLISEAPNAGPGVEGEPAPLIGRRGYQSLAQTMKEQGDNAQRIANRLSDLLAGIEPEDAD